MNNILLIVEGSEFEKKVFNEIFSNYGFNTIISEEPLLVENVGEFEKYQFTKDQDNIVIVQGPRTRIHGFLKYYDNNAMELEKLFSYTYGYFKGIFLIYDVDHNDNDDVEEMYRRYSDESGGMLLLSSPCLEVLADYNHNRTETKYFHLYEYKADINKHFEGGTVGYISHNINNLLLYYLEKNYKEFGEPNIMEHPRLIVDFINNNNERINLEDKENSYVIYRYFSTVIYVAIAYAHGLTREIENYKIVSSFLKNQEKGGEKDGSI